jgi:hypothetical protein
MKEYSYERIVDPDAPQGVHFRVRDPEDNRLATCYLESNAMHLADALNYFHGLPVRWSCGHLSHGQCAICFHELAGKAAALRAELDAVLTGQHTIMRRIIDHFRSFMP